MLIRELLLALDSADLCSGLLLAALLLFVGDKIVTDELRKPGVLLATVLFLLSVLVRVARDGPHSGSAWLDLMVGALLTGGAALGFFWITLPTFSFLSDATVGALWRRGQDWRRQAEERRRRREREHEERQRRREYEQRAPERERERQDADARTCREADARRRRENFRVQCELFYNLHEAEIGGRFKREMFTDYLQRYMGEERTPEDVEQRAEKLMELMKDALEKASPARKLNSVENILAWYDGEMARLTPLPDGDQKDILIAQLTAKRDEFLFQHLEEQDR